MAIDGLDQADVLGQFVEQGNATKGGTIDAVVEFEVEITAAAKNGLSAIGKFGFVEASLDDTLACSEFVA